ncbi:MAG: hypothetical protein ACREHD_06780, partial [Pirellulales bacterium]
MPRLRHFIAAAAIAAFGIPGAHALRAATPESIDFDDIQRRLVEWRAPLANLRIVWEEMALPPSNVPLVESPPPAEAENSPPFSRTEWIWSDQGFDLLNSRQFFYVQGSKAVDGEVHSIDTFNGPKRGLFHAHFRKSKNEEVEKFVQLDLIGLGDAKPTSAIERTPLRGLYWPLTAQWLPEIISPESTEMISPESKWKLERIEEVAGEPCARLSEAPYRHGTTLWLDINHGCLVRRYQSQGFPGNQLGFDFLVDEFQQLNGSIWFPKRGRIQMGAMGTGGTPAPSKNQMFVVTEAAVNQSIDMARFEPPTPDARTIVHDQGSPFTEVISAWRRQNPDSAVPPTAEKEWLRAASAMSGWQALRFILAGALVVFLIGLFLLSRRRRQGRFFQCSVRQLLLLVAVSALLSGLLTPRVHRILHSRRVQEEADRRQTVSDELVAAVQANNVARARQALVAGAEADLKLTSGPYSKSFLTACILKGHVEMMELLLDHGADVEEIDDF